MESAALAGPHGHTAASDWALRGSAASRVRGAARSLESPPQERPRQRAVGATKAARFSRPTPPEDGVAVEQVVSREPQRRAAERARLERAHRVAKRCTRDKTHQGVARAQPAAVGGGEVERGRVVGGRAAPGAVGVHVEERHEARERLPQQDDRSEGPSLEACEQRRLKADVPGDNLLRVRVGVGVRVRARARVRVRVPVTTLTCAGSIPSGPRQSGPCRVRFEFSRRSTKCTSR